MRVLIWVIQARAFAGIRRCFFVVFFLNYLAHEIFSNASLCISCVRDTAAKSGFLAIISHKVKFSKDIVLKSEGIIKALFDAFSPTTFIFLKIAAHICRGALSMTCSKSCWSLHFLLTNTDAHSDSGHQSFGLLWSTLRAILKTL